MHEIGFHLHFLACLKAVVVLAELAGSFSVIHLVEFLSVSGIKTILVCSLHLALLCYIYLVKY